MKTRLLLLCVLLVGLAWLLVASERAVAGSFAVQTPHNRKVYLPIVSNPHPLPLPDEPGYCLTAEEAKLASLINAYRGSHGLPAVPLSRSLSTVAQWHVRDLQWHNPNSGMDSRGQACNMHSWSNEGHWTPVCYTSDHAYASGMWLKPTEITRGIYTSYGFEIAAGGRGWTATAEGALTLWTKSSAHNAVILEEGVWAGYNWPAMGIGIYEGYVVVWFARMSDPAGIIPACN